MNRKGKMVFLSAVSALLFCGSVYAGQEQAAEKMGQSKTQTESEEGAGAAQKKIWLPDSAGLEQAIRDNLARDEFWEMDFPFGILADQIKGAEVSIETEIETETESASGSKTETETESVSGSKTETETETELQPVFRTACAEGYENGLVYVTVTVNPDGTIARVEIANCSSQTDTIGQIAAPAVARQIEKAQSVQVDGVTGATYTSDAVKEAAGKAIDAARRTLGIPVS